MKKVLAFLSTLLLAFTCFSLISGQNIKAASDGKWTVDPTLAEDEVPLYIMSSIYTTFPNYYDNAAEPDPNWGGAARMYPWNETRLRIPKLDANGNPDKYYAVYFDGLTTAGIGTGNNILLYELDDNNNVVLKRMGGGKYDSAGHPMNPSLSHYRYNNTGQNIEFDAYSVFSAGGSNAENLYNRVLIFDGNGKAIRGISGDEPYAKPDAENPSALNAYTPEYCYIDGKLSLYNDENECDRLQVEKLDENGDPIIDGDGNTVMEDTDEPNLLYQRFVWEWFAEEPTTEVNTVGYLEDGWDGRLWDYCYPQSEALGGGYICIAFSAGAGKNFKMTDVQLAAHNKTLRANGEIAEGAADLTSADRECYQMVRIPAGGVSFDFGYLDKGIIAGYNAFNDMVYTGYKYGRSANYNMQIKTYDFSASGLKYVDTQKNNYSYRLMDGQNVVEVIKGQKFKPSWNISYTGLANYFKEKDDITSYTNDTAPLQFKLSLNGVTVVLPPAYENKEDLVADFIKDFNEHLGRTEENKYVFPTEHSQAALDEFYALRWDIAGTSQNANLFSSKEPYKSKWAWLWDYIYNNTSEAKKASVKVVGDGTVGSPGYFTIQLYAFLLSAPATYMAGIGTSDAWDNEKGTTGFLPETTNLEDFLNYEIDTTNDNIDKSYVITYEVTNTVTGVSDAKSLTYVVVNEYTPVLEVNNNNLIVPTSLDHNGRVVINNGEPINPYQFVKAYNGAYSDYNKNLLGDDISYKVHFTSDTLDFNNPTEGNHKVVARVYNQAKYAEKTFTVYIEDLTAPMLTVMGSVTIPYGSLFHVSQLVLNAEDRVDGNLMNNLGTLLRDASTTKVDTTKPGTYNVTLELYDKTGNSTTARVVVQVLPAPLTGTDFDNKLDEKLDEYTGQILDELGALEDLSTEAIEKLNQLTSGKCNKKSLYVVEFAAAASLLVLVLRKRNK